MIGTDANQQIATTIEQARRLLACGADPHTADMNWSEFIPDEPNLCVGGVTYQYDDDYNPIINDKGQHVYYGFPAWSLLAIIGKLFPTAIRVEDGEEAHNFRLTLRYSKRGTWVAKCIVIEESSEPIEACIKVLEWLTAHGYKLNEGNFTKTDEHEG